MELMVRGVRGMLCIAWATWRGKETAAGSEAASAATVLEEYPVERLAGKVAVGRAWGGGRAPRSVEEGAGSSLRWESLRRVVALASLRVGANLTTAAAATGPTRPY